MGARLEKLLLESLMKAGNGRCTLGTLKTSPSDRAFLTASKGGLVAMKRGHSFVRGGSSRGLTLLWLLTWFSHILIQGLCMGCRLHLFT